MLPIALVSIVAYALVAVIVLPMVWGIRLFDGPLSLAGKLIALLVRLLGG